MTGVEVFFIVFGIWLLVSLAIAVGLSIFQWVCLPISVFITQVREYHSEKDKRVGERGQ